MSGSTLGWSGDSNDPVNLAVNIGKLQTFCRNLEDRIEKNEGSKDDLIKITVELDVLKGKASELRARMTSVEDLIEDVESAKKALKMLNPKTLITAGAILMGGSVGGNTVIESFDHQEQVIKQEVDQQDEKIDLLLKKINEIQEEKKD